MPPVETVTPGAGMKGLLEGDVPPPVSEFKGPKGLPPPPTGWKGLPPALPKAASSVPWPPTSAVAIPNGDGLKSGDDSCPKDTPGPAPTGMRLAILCGGKGTVRASCGEMGVWNRAGHTRYTSKSGMAACPPFRALNNASSESWSGCPGAK